MTLTFPWWSYAVHLGNGVLTVTVSTTRLFPDLAELKCEIRFLLERSNFVLHEGISCEYRQDLILLSFKIQKKVFSLNMCLHKSWSNPMVFLCQVDASRQWLELNLINRSELVRELIVPQTIVGTVIPEDIECQIYFGDFAIKTKV